MLFTNTKFLSVLAAAAAVKGAPVEGNDIQARAVVNHDSINPWPENVPGGALGNTLKRFEPYLHIAHGCQPYSAVDGYGNTRYDNSSFCSNDNLLTHFIVADFKTPEISPLAAVIKPRVKPMFGVPGLVENMVSCTPGVSDPNAPRVYSPFL